MTRRKHKIRNAVLALLSLGAGCAAAAWYYSMLVAR